MANARETANRHAENAARAGAQASLYLAIALILGIIVAAVGGFMGVKNMREDYMAHNYVATHRNEVGYREEF